MKLFILASFFAYSVLFSSYISSANIRENSRLKKYIQKEFSPQMMANMTHSNDYLLSLDYDFDYLNYKRSFMNLAKNLSRQDVDLKVYIVNRLSQDYYDSYYRRMMIEQFTNDLAYLVFKGNTTLDSSSLLIVISILDRQIRVRTGASITNRLPYDKISLVLDNIKSYFRSYKYEEGIIYMLTNFESIIRTGYYSDKSIGRMEVLTAVLIIFFVIYIFVSCCLRLCCGFKIVKQEVVDYKGKNILNKLKSVLKKKKAPREFLDSTCVICLEEFEIVGNQVSGSTVLPCGHVFHDECVENWLKKSSNCPTCRQSLDNLNENDTKVFSERLVLIQRDNYPTLELIDFAIDTYFNLTWSYDPIITTSYVDFDFSSPLGPLDFFTLSGNFISVAGEFGSGSGGASSSW